MKRTVSKLAAVAAVACGILWWAVATRSATPDPSDLLNEEALKSGDEPARLAAIDALGASGQQLERAVPALIEQLGADSPAVRAHAAHALGRIGPPAGAAAEALARLVGDADKQVRREAVRALADVRPPAELCIPLFCRLLREAEPEVRLSAMDAMAGEGKLVVPPLIEALGNEEACYWACLVLGEIGPDAEAAVGPLAKLARSDPRPEVRREAILALAAIGPKAAPAVPSLTAVLADDQVNVGPAIFALGSIGPEAKAAEATLKGLAGKADSPPLVQAVSLWALARMNPGDKELLGQVVPRLLAALKSSDPGLRAAAVRALVDLNPDPEMVLPLAKQVMADADPQVVDDIVNVVAGLGETAVPQLIEALKYKQVRAKAAQAIARIGPPARAAVPALIQALGDEDPKTRSEVLFALAAIGPDAAEAVPAVARLLDDPDTGVCYAACDALGRIGRAAIPAKAQLQRMLDAPDEFLAMASAWALACIDPESRETSARSVPVLIKALEASDAMTRLHAAEALGRLGPLAGPAAAALKGRLQDGDEHVRDAAAQALKAIEG